MLGYQGLKETIIIRVIGVIRKDSVLLKISDKIYRKSKKIKQNWTIPEKFVIPFCVSFDNYFGALT